MSIVYRNVLYFISSIVFSAVDDFNLKGNEALEFFFFLSSPRQGNMKRKSKLKNDFWEVKEESSMVENGVFLT